MRRSRPVGYTTQARSDRHAPAGAARSTGAATRRATASRAGTTTRATATRSTSPSTVARRSTRNTSTSGPPAPAPTHVTAAGLAALEARAGRPAHRHATGGHPARQARPRAGRPSRERGLRGCAQRAVVPRGSHPLPGADAQDRPGHRRRPHRRGRRWASTVRRSRSRASASTLHIVGSTEADPATGRISNASPVGRALLGHRAGDDVVIPTPAQDAPLPDHGGRPRPADRRLARGPRAARPARGAAQWAARAGPGSGGSARTRVAWPRDAADPPPWPVAVVRPARRSAAGRRHGRRIGDPADADAPRICSTRSHSTCPCCSRATRLDEHHAARRGGWRPIAAARRGPVVSRHLPRSAASHRARPAERPSAASGGTGSPPFGARWASAITLST